MYRNIKILKILMISGTNNMLCIFQHIEFCQFYEYYVFPPVLFYLICNILSHDIGENILISKGFRICRINTQCI